MKYQLTLTLLVITLASCSPAEEPLPSMDTAPAASETEAEHEASPSIDQGQFGSVSGYVLWNEQPLEGVSVIVTDEWSLDSTHLGSTETDSNGYYFIDRLPPGEQVVYVGEGHPEFFNVDAEPVIIFAGEEAQVETMYLCKEFEPESPADGAIVNTANPILDWSQYPDAAGYVVHVHYLDGTDSAGVWQIVFAGGSVDEPVEETSVLVDMDLSLGVHHWVVYAINSNGHTIACSSWGRTFSIELP